MGGVSLLLIFDSKKKKTLITQPCVSIFYGEERSTLFLFVGAMTIFAAVERNALILNLHHSH